jgi:PAS domain S-box-containing protein
MANKIQDSARDMADSGKTYSPGSFASLGWEQTFDAVTDLISIIDTNYRIVRVNKALAAKLGTAPGKCTGLTCYSCFHNTDELPSSCPHTLLLKDGLEHKAEIHEDAFGGDFILTVSPLRGADGKLLGSIHICHDITERNRIEKDLLANQRLTQDIMDNSTSLIYIVDTEGRFITFNKSMERLLGTTNDRLKGKTRDMILPEKIAQKHRDNDLEVIRTKKSLFFEEENDEPDGRHFYLSQKFPLLSPEGEVYAIAGISTDITERKAAEEALQKSEDKYRTVADFTYDWEYWLGPDGNYRYISPSCERISGYSSDELIKNPALVMQMVHPDDRQMVEEHIRDAVNEPEPRHLDFRIITREGKEVWVSHFCQAVYDTEGRQNGRRGSNRDITERKQDIKLLKESEEKFRSIIEASTDQIFLLDKDCRYLAVNKTLANLFRKSPQEMVGKAISELLPEDTAARFSKNIKEVFDTGKSISLEEQMIVQDHQFYISTSLNPVNDEKGNVTAVTGIVRDITGRREVEQALQESKALVDAVVESVPLMIFLKEAKDLRFVIFNRAGEELLGYDRKDLLGKNNLDLFPPEQAANFMTKDREVLDGKDGFLDIPEEPIATARKGQRLLHTRKVCIRGADGVTKYLLGISEDITDRKLAAEELASSELRFRTLFESSKDAIMTLEPPSWKFTSGNPATVKMFLAKDEADFVSRGPWDMSPERQPDGRLSGEKAKEMIEMAIRDGSNFFEWTHRRLDGEDFFATVLLMRVELPEKIFCQATVRDITEQRAAEENLRKRKDELEKFNKLAVDRELKMIELKKQLNELQGRAGICR